MPIIPEDADLRLHTERLRAFARAREWEQFHTPKNLVMAITVEAAELMEPLQWLTADEAEGLKDDAEARAEIGSEIADVAIYLIRLADVLGIDIGSAIASKIDRNEERFPVEVVRGKSRMPGVGLDP
jgi:NTP pyrophosphatase (non-canonical NTP hydrolase)